MGWLRKALGLGNAEGPSAKVFAATAADWKTRGNSALAGGRLEEARHCYEQALLAAPSDAGLRVNLGFTLLEQGHASAAVESFHQALALGQPGDAFAHEALYLMGRAYRLLGETGNALARLADAVAAQPTFSLPVEEAVAILQELNRHDEALEWARRRAGIESTPAALLALGQCAYLAGRRDDARNALDEVLRADPHNATALEGRASFSLEEGRPQDALTDFEAALRAGADGPNIRFGKAMALRRCGRSLESLHAFEGVLSIDPRHHGALSERAGLLLELLRPREAEEALNRAISLYPDDPDLVWGRATARLLDGNLEGGWADYEVRHTAPSAKMTSPPPRYDVPRWTGAESLQGRRILVLAEQGLGDSIQFARYLPLLQQRGASVTFQVSSALHSLIHDAMPDVRLVDGGDIEKPDYQILLLSLPLAFRTTLASVPGGAPYLRSRPELRAAWEARLGPRRGLRVGVVWSGGTLYAGDAQRSLVLEAFREIEIPGVQFVCLQKEIRDRDRAAMAGWPTLSHYGADLNTFADTAALADCMDLVISSCTSVAHLAGGLGRPLWMLLAHYPDWRWLLGREDSPWYPSARLFRQPEPGDWSSVLQRVRAELAQFAQAPRAQA